MNKYDKMVEKDYIAEGWNRIDPKLVTDKPPKIQWGSKYLEWDDKKRIGYLEQLAGSMNHACDLIQKERNKLLELCELKEKQLLSMRVAMDQNTKMLHSEVTRMNTEKQELLKDIAESNKEIVELRNGNNN